MSEGRLLGIARRERKRAPMQALERASVTGETGVAGDFRGRPGDRQVTVLARESWEAACRELGTEIAWTSRRANLLVEGLALAERAGDRIVIGDTVLEITGETDPCSRMDEASPGLRLALTPDWRGGVCCRVVSGGEIRIGDSVRLESPDV